MKKSKEMNFERVNVVIVAFSFREGEFKAAVKHYTLLVTGQ